MEQDDKVEVLDLEFILAVPGRDGRPATLEYTVREHVGDAVTEQPGAVAIHFAGRDVDGRKVPGDHVTIATAQLVGMHRRVRLERRVRPALTEQAEVEALKAKHRVYDPRNVFREPSTSSR